MFTPVATAEAVEEHDILEKAMSYHNLYVNHSEQGKQKRKDFFKYLSSANEGVQQKKAGVFTKLVRATLPLWQTEVNHNKTHSFSIWLTHRWPHQNVPYQLAPLYNALVTFYECAYGVEDEVAWRYASRIDRYIELDNVEMQSVNSLFIQSNFDVDDIQWFVNHPARHYLFHVYYALARGYSPALMRKVGNRIYHGYSPVFAARMIQKTTSGTLTKLASLETSGRPELVETFLEGLIDAGFSDDKEVRRYATTFGIPWSDDNFYTRVINAKNLYPNLEDYTPVV